MPTTFTNGGVFLVNGEVLRQRKANRELNNRETGSGLVYGCIGKEIKQSLHATYCESFRALVVKGYLWIQAPIFVTWSNPVETAAQRHIDGEFYPIYESMLKIEVSFANVCCRLELFRIVEWQMESGGDVSKTINVDAFFFPSFFFKAKPTKFCVRPLLGLSVDWANYPFSFRSQDTLQRSSFQSW